MWPHGRSRVCQLLQKCRYTTYGPIAGALRNKGISNPQRTQYATWTLSARKDPSQARLLLLGDSSASAENCWRTASPDTSKSPWSSSSGYLRLHIVDSTITTAGGRSNAAISSNSTVYCGRFHTGTSRWYSKKQASVRSTPPCTSSRRESFAASSRGMRTSCVGGYVQATSSKRFCRHSTVQVTIARPFCKERTDGILISASRAHGDEDMRSILNNSKCPLSARRSYRSVARGSCEVECCCGYCSIRREVGLAFRRRRRSETIPILTTPFSGAFHATLATSSLATTASPERQQQHSLTLWCARPNLCAGFKCCTPTYVQGHCFLPPAVSALLPRQDASRLFASSAASQLHNSPTLLLSASMQQNAWCVLPAACTAGALPSSAASRTISSSTASAISTGAADSSTVALGRPTNTAQGDTTAAALSASSSGENGAVSGFVGRLVFRKKLQQLQHLFVEASCLSESGASFLPSSSATSNNKTLCSALSSSSASGGLPSLEHSHRAGGRLAAGRGAAQQQSRVGPDYRHGITGSGSSTTGSTEEQRRQRAAAAEQRSQALRACIARLDEMFNAPHQQWLPRFPGAPVGSKRRRFMLQQHHHQHPQNQHQQRWQRVKEKQHLFEEELKKAWLLHQTQKQCKAEPRGANATAEQETAAACHVTATVGAEIETSGITDAEESGLFTSFEKSGKETRSEDRRDNSKEAMLSAAAERVAAAAAALRTATAAAAVEEGREEEQLSAQEALYIAWRLASSSRGKRDFAVCLKGLNLLTNFGRLHADQQLSDKLFALAMHCGLEDQAAELLQVFDCFLSHPPRDALLFALLDTARAANRLRDVRKYFSLMREHWQIRVRPAAYVICLRALLQLPPDATTEPLKEALLVYQDAHSMGVPLPPIAHELLIEKLLSFFEQQRLQLQHHPLGGTGQPQQPQAAETQHVERFAPTDLLLTACCVEMRMRRDLIRLGLQQMPPHALLHAAWLRWALHRYAQEQQQQSMQQSSQQEHTEDEEHQLKKLQHTPQQELVDSGDDPAATWQLTLREACIRNMVASTCYSEA